ncbi:ABC transporter ATP-binding protein [Lederbergia lenta]|uniref:Putative ABC transporter ATP-binding/permease n=1 Tax=Lederbergia lenta TaxID=1467 RepID=A0A2X4ZFP4_LEDLE|nr:ABC transporter ATP-binding protein [Lederbergia lenta]MEC2326102.1 ABC transporter ATP-binding protein [Lederbergia lenta]SQI63465.1 putative ABC transporter ATP-binding/permease [Lederbergia lenta]
MVKSDKKNQSNDPTSGIRPGRHIPTGPVVKAKNTKETLHRLWHYLRKQKLGLIAVTIFTAISAVLMLTGPYLIGMSIDRYIVPRDYDGLVTLCLVLLGVYIASSAFSWLQMHVMAAISQHTIRDMRSELFDKVQKLPISYFDKTPHGELMSRTTNDMETVSNTLNQSMAQFINSILTLVGVIIFMLVMDIKLTLVSMVIIPIVILTTKKIATYTRKFFSNQQKELGSLNGFIEETVSGQKVIKVYRREAKTLGQFQAKNRALRDVAKKAQIFAGVMGPSMNFINNLSFALIAGIGGWMALREIVTIGVVVAFLNYSKQFSRPINELASQFNLLQSAIAGAERIFEVMDEVEEDDEGERKPKIPSVQRSIEFKNVTFSYIKEDGPVLKDVSFTVEKGQNIALVGPTGAGKTTIINLLTRFYDIEEGSIRIDDRDIKEWDRNSLRRRIGIVLQDAFLFSGSVMENIRYGRLDATDDEVLEAAQMANADSFICKLPNGYASVLSADGGNLSQGQRQLITIARAILANPDILILDEATSSIDTRTESQIQQAMKTLMVGRTSFVIAHRLSTIREADVILVIKDGEIYERGNHDALMEQKGFYYEMQMNVTNAQQAM